MHAGAQVWARAQALEGEPDGFNSALLSLLAAHLTASGTLVPILLLQPPACHVPLGGHLQAQGVHLLVYLSSSCVASWNTWQAELMCCLKLCGG